MIKIRYTIKGQYETFSCVGSYDTWEKVVKAIVRMVDTCEVVKIELEEQA